MSNVGPVCHIPPANTQGNPQPQNLPGLPPAVSPNGGGSQQQINNAFAALLNAMRQLLMQLANQQKVTNNTINNISNAKSSSGNWNETTRVTEKVRVYQNNDPTSQNYIDVEQINKLTMTDKVTGHTWTWSR